MKNLGRDIISLADSLAIEKHMVAEVNEKLKPFRKNPGDLDLMTMCELEHMLGEQLFTIPPPLTKQQLRKKKLEQLDRICREDEYTTIWATYDPNNENNQWYNFA